jgi:hypothetical protein
LIGYLDLEGLECYSCMSRRWWRCRLHEVPHIKLPGKILFLVKDVDAYLDKFRQGPQQVDLDGILARAGVRRSRRGGDH